MWLATLFSSVSFNPSTVGPTCPDELQKDAGAERTGQGGKDRRNFLRVKLKKKKMKKRKKKKRKSQPGEEQENPPDRQSLS